MSDDQHPPDRTKLRLRLKVEQEKLWDMVARRIGEQGSISQDLELLAQSNIVDQLLNHWLFSFPDDLKTGE